MKFAYVRIVILVFLLFRFSLADTENKTKMAIWSGLALGAGIGVVLFWVITHPEVKSEAEPISGQGGTDFGPKPGLPDVTVRPSN